MHLCKYNKYCTGKFANERGGQRGGDTNEEELCFVNKKSLLRLDAKKNQTNSTNKFIFCNLEIVAL